ncbi:hypothetical protein ID866_769 [Astraeus odoratus]|nr:hypothetical protein ID866_769 [Astraeus odoratus]
MSHSSSPASPASTAPTSLPSPEIQSLSIRDVSDVDRERAAKLKAEANKAFMSHSFTDAIKLYSEAIELNPTDATFWCNRATARTKLEEYGFALSDASKAIEVDPKYAKAYYRYLSSDVIAKPQMAVADFKKVITLEPKNDIVRAQLVATQKLAIEMEEEKNAVERCLEIIAEGPLSRTQVWGKPMTEFRLGGCEVENDYLGPQLNRSEDGKYIITQGFILKMIDWFKQGKKLPRRYAWEILLGAHAGFIKEESLVEVKLQEGETCDVIGDIHGQFYDLLHLYALTGTPTANHCLLMNGDLVDRGSWSIEVILTAFAYKLPLATLVGATKKSANVNSKTILSPEGFKRYFVVHGGLFSKDDVVLDDVRKIPRIGRQPGQEGLMCEGVGLAFGPDITKKWYGYAIEHDGLCTTVFSAPNYVDQVGNKGAYIRIDACGDVKYHQFEAQPHPPLKPMAYAMGGLANLMIGNLSSITTTYRLFTYLLLNVPSVTMDKTKSKLAAFFDNDDEESSFPQKAVDETKLSQYAQGTVRKSRREKEKEAAEAKKKEEEENAARAYVEFLDAFEGEDASRRKSGSNFVRAAGDSNVRAPYQPSLKSAQEASSKTAKAFREEMEDPSPAPSAPKPKGKRAMDTFLEEIKREQALREARYARSAHGRSVTALAAYEGQSGSKDRGDPETTNLFVANLPANVTEQSLGTFFARHGPVGSVKIMWPRGDIGNGPGGDMTASRRNRNAGLSGFVSFMKRKHAEAALRELDGFDWGGSVLRVGWSKAVPMGNKPLYGVGNIMAAGVAGVGLTLPGAVHARALSQAIDQVVVHGAVPGVSVALLRTDDIGRTAVADMIVGVLEDGPAVSRDDGYNSIYSTDSAEESEQERTKKTVLGKLARKRFEAMLRGLSGKRGELARCMTFSLEHAEASREVSDIIISSLLVDSTPVPRKIARLHLICDILHNSAAPVPSAWKYRQEFQARLGIVFDHFSSIYHSFPGRITAETFKKQITSVVDIWEDWIVFSPEFTSELRARLDGTTHAEARPTNDDGDADMLKTEAQFVSKFKSKSFQPARDTGSYPTTTRDPATDKDDDVDGAPIEDMDVDGVPLEDVDGVPLDDDVDGVPLEDVDGIPLDHANEGPMRDVNTSGGDDAADDADIDGEPMDDIDGIPL